MKFTIITKTIFVNWGKLYMPSEQIRICLTHDPLNLRNVETVVYLRKRSHNRLLPRLQVKKWVYMLLQLNTTVSKLI